MGKKITIIVLCVAVAGALAYLGKDMLVVTPTKKKERQTQCLAASFKKAYALGVEARRLEQKGDLFAAAERYSRAADGLWSSLADRGDDPKAPGIKQKMRQFYQRAIALFCREAAARAAACLCRGPRDQEDVGGDGRRPRPRSPAGQLPAGSAQVCPAPV